MWSEHIQICIQRIMCCHSPIFTAIDTYTFRGLSYNRVNLCTRELFHYMQSIAKSNPLVREEISNYKCMQYGWLFYLSGRVDGFVDRACCDQVSHPHLSIGICSSEWTSKLLKWDWANNTACISCGVEKNYGISKCEILSKSTAQFNALEWVLAEQPGVNKTYKKNTQLELGLCILPVREVVKKLITQLYFARVHQCQYEWRNQMMRIDLTISNPDLYYILYTDFGATLDLMALEKDNSSVNNHPVICTSFLCSNWRWASLNIQDEDGEDILDKIILNDYDMWICFGDTQSKCKNNDHIFYNACLTHIIQFYDAAQGKYQKNTILFTIVWTDICLTQEKYRQNFWRVACSAKHNKSVIVHKFASWSATENIVKVTINNSHCRHERCANTYDCYMKMKHLSRNGKEESTLKLLEYGVQQDVWLLENTSFCCRRTYVGLGIESTNE